MAEEENSCYRSTFNLRSLSDLTLPRVRRHLFGYPPPRSPLIPCCPQILMELTKSMHIDPSHSIITPRSVSGVQQSVNTDRCVSS